MLLSDSIFQSCTFYWPRLRSLSNGCNVGAGDRLISVNDTKLHGLSHATTVDILQNAPEDVTLVVSQPKERLYRGERGGVAFAAHAQSCHVTSLSSYLFYLLLVLAEAAAADAIHAKATMNTFSSDQDGEVSVDDLSEERVRTESPSPPPPSSNAIAATFSPVHQQANLQDSKTNAVKTKTKPNGVQQCLDRILATAASSATSKPQKGLEPMPPALPPKTRKPKFSEAPKVTDHSDRGDSDLDEDAYYSSQEKVKKVGVKCC